MGSGTGRGTLGEVWDGSGDPLGGLGRVGGPLERSETGRGTHPEVRDGLGDPRSGARRSEDTQAGPERFGGPTSSSGTG